MEMNGLNAAYLGQVNHIQANAAANHVQNLVNSDFASATDKELMDACREFESYLIEQVIRRMENTVNLFSGDKEQTGSALVDFFMDSTIQKVSGDITEKQGLGIAQTLYESMKRQYKTDI